jgi:hypothetical protein
MDFASEGPRPVPSPVPVLDLPGPSRRIVVEPLEAPERPVELPAREPSGPAEPSGPTEPGHPETAPSEDPARSPGETPEKAPA